MTARILVVDDDNALSEMIGIVLQSEGFDPSFCADGALALEAFRSLKPDLVLLDLMLPGLDGIEVCSLIRAESGTPIIMLTARTDTTDVVKGLESGADDYMVKPFNPKELVARIRTRLRPAAAGGGKNLQIGDLVVDEAGHEVRRGADHINSHRWSSTCSWRLRRNPSRSLPGRCSWSRCGVTTTRPTHAS
jgi:two-component system response regulator MtrA